jgi:EAL domain-containing protein (putative c-di-GMP-specific phosphodiesterase class I)
MPVPPVPDGRPARASWVETLFTDDLMRAVAASGGGALVYVALRRLRKLRVALVYAELARVVAAVRGRLWDGTRPIDLVQDLGDGRFVVVVPRVSDMGALEPALRTLLAALQQDIDGAGRPVHPSFWVGVTFFPTNGVDLLDLLRQAELSLAEDLRAAIDADALNVVYQTFIDARTQTLRGAEALVRWEHPQHGPISPARFVPIAEEAGFVRRITDFVMRTAARAVAESLDALPAGFYVSVNLSGQEILEPDRAEQVLAMVRAAGLPPERLQVEITEGVLMRERRRAVQMLQRLRDAGVGVATDDFGTGYSSLAYLAELPVQVLKIDRLFVRDLPAPSAVQLLQSISALGHSLGLTVLVEGVENDPQLEACLAWGVDVIQGYCFGRPRSFASLLAWTEPPVPTPPAAPPGPMKDLPLLLTTVAALWSGAVGQTGPGLAALARADAGLAGELLRLAAERGEVGVGPTPDLAAILRALGADTLLAALESRRAPTLALPPRGGRGGASGNTPASWRAGRRPSGPASVPGTGSTPSACCTTWGASCCSTTPAPASRRSRRAGGTPRRNSRSSRP